MQMRRLEVSEFDAGYIAGALAAIGGALIAYYIWRQLEDLYEAGRSHGRSEIQLVNIARAKEAAKEALRESAEFYSARAGQSETAAS